jgi:hypothetical protein
MKLYKTYNRSRFSSSGEFNFNLYLASKFMVELKLDAGGLFSIYLQ